MFSKKPVEPQNVSPEIEVGVLREAEDGSEILFGLARLLESSNCTDYAKQVRGAATAVRALTSDHSEADETAPDSVFGAAEHASEIRRAFKLA